MINYLKRTRLADSARAIRAYVYRSFGKEEYLGIKKHQPLILLSDKEKATFFGYHDKTPFSLDGSKVLAMSVEANDRKGKSEGIIMRLGYFSRNGASFDKEFKAFAETRAWCWQQGCMLQWSNTEANSRVFFNTAFNGK